MKNNTKNFCHVHCFHYSGSVCPFCEKDKVNAYVRRYYKEDKKNEEKIKVIHVNKVEDEKVTDDMLLALKMKFAK